MDCRVGGVLWYDASGMKCLQSEKHFNIIKSKILMNLPNPNPVENDELL